MEKKTIIINWSFNDEQYNTKYFFCFNNIQFVFTKYSFNNIGEFATFIGQYTTDKTNITILLLHKSNEISRNKLIFRNPNICDIIIIEFDGKTDADNEFIYKNNGLINDGICNYKIMEKHIRLLNNNNNERIDQIWTYLNFEQIIANCNKALLNSFNPLLISLRAYIVENESDQKLYGGSKLQQMIDFISTENSFLSIKCSIECYKDAIKGVSDNRANEIIEELTKLETCITLLKTKIEDKSVKLNFIEIHLSKVDENLKNLVQKSRRKIIVT